MYECMYVSRITYYFVDCFDQLWIELEHCHVIYRYKICMYVCMYVCFYEINLKKKYFSSGNVCMYDHIGVLYCWGCGSGGWLGLGPGSANTTLPYYDCDTLPLGEKVAEHHPLIRSFDSRSRSHIHTYLRLN